MRSSAIGAWLAGYVLHGGPKQQGTSEDCMWSMLITVKLLCRVLDNSKDLTVIMKIFIFNYKYNKGAALPYNVSQLDNDLPALSIKIVQCNEEECENQSQ